MFVCESPVAIVAIATPSAQTVAAAAREIPVVFSAVTDPVAAKLVKSWEAPGANITGVSDMLPIEKHLDMLQRVMPDAKRIGTVYNPGEANAAALVELLEERLSARGLELVKGAATKTSEVLGAARSLVGKADAIYLTTDNTVISAAEAVISVGERAKIPVFAADTATVERGAVAALGFNYYNHGRQTGAMVARVLEGASTADMPVEIMEELDLYVNPEAGERMGITLSEDLIQEAVKVVKNDKERLPAAGGPRKGAPVVFRGESIRMLSEIAFYGALRAGVRYGLVAVGIYLSPRVVDFPDLT